MVCVALVCTSAGFFLPAFVASKLKKHTEKLLISALASTSILYHGTVHPLARVIDTCVAHLTAIHFVTKNIRLLFMKKKASNLVSLMWCCISAWMYYKRSLVIADHKISSRWHMGVHLSAQTALMYMLYAPLDMMISNNKSYELY
jgi:hypothetical protein